ncbi:hypothetical protein HanXRQr2_Chr16g0729801 [Helianthus annuus]|uniref:Uncharacterized protein n=1 Tax=Helianthus annuus TaxID=4232 RepID=A0A9K3DNB5_HELAN|nr:hypothetical protein HanXRQr2_Chr16g0729801 [Helianthus annuus]
MEKMWVNIFQSARWKILAVMHDHSMQPHVPMFCLKKLNRGALGGELRHDSLTVVVYLYLRLDVAALPFRLVVNLYPNEP